MSGDISSSKLNLTSDEKRLYKDLFRQADSESLGVVTGDIAVKFFERTKLDPTLLGEIWQLSDPENVGFLTPARFSMALRLIGHCQTGRQPSAELATQAGPLPRFDAAAPVPGAQPADPAPASPRPTSASQPPTDGPLRIPPLPPDKVAVYGQMFERSGARSGMLGGDAAKQIFERSGLPNEILGHVWNLVDTQQRGALSQVEFVIAMHLLASIQEGSLRAPPQSLPQGLYEAAARKPPSRPGADSPVPRQLTGQGPPRIQSPASRVPALSPQGTGQPNDWLISPQEKANFDREFDKLDVGRAGFITGDQAVPFFSQSLLPEESLASIWDLADINSEGQLNRDEFAVAMYLIKQQRAKTTDRGQLPQSLPANLVPPSMRKRAIPPSQPTAPAFIQAPAQPPPQSKSAAEDLFGLDALSATSDSPKPVPASPSSPQQTSRPAFPPSAGSGPAATFKPFIPVSSFGQGLAAQNTGGSVGSDSSKARDLPQTQIPRQQQQSLPQIKPATQDDLLGDNDPEVSRNLTQDTTDLANMSNQIGQLRSQMQETQTRKVSTQEQVHNAANQKRELEARLAQFRTQYENERSEVQALESQLSASKSETQKLQKELGMIEGTHKDLQTRHRELSATLDADQTENAQLKERIRVTNGEITELKLQLEKMQADSRQQRGMVAINKKQLSTNETQKEKIDAEMKEIERANAEREAALRSAQQQAAQQQAAQQQAAQQQAAQQAAQVPAAPSPAPSTSVQSMNPFFRMSSTTSLDRTMSPSIFTQDFGNPSSRKSEVDSFFGPSEPSVSETTHGLSSFEKKAADTSGFSTPVTSPPAFGGDSAARSIEPPSPPVSRQMDSSNLPLRTSTLRSESFSSSVKAHPPASRAGFSAAATPTQFSDSPSASVNGDEPRSQDATREMVPDVTSAPKFEPTPDVMSKPEEYANDESLSQGETGVTELARSLPGGFPAESPTGSGPAEDSFLDATSTQHESADPFAPRDEHSTPTAAVEPVREPVGTAFNALGQTRDLQETQGPGISASQNPESEFPPIREIDDGDDSSSDSDVERGFDDDFTAASPPRATTNTVAGFAPTNELAPSKPTVAEIGSSQTSGQQTPVVQHPPPSFSESVTDAYATRMLGTNAAPPADFGGLLPGQNLAASAGQEPPPPAGLERSAFSPESSFSSSGQALQPVANTTTAPPSQELHMHGQQLRHPSPAPPQPKDEFDFDDLEEAKADEQSHEAFGAPPGYQQSQNDFEFSPMFDSPSMSKHSTFSEQTPTAAATTSKIGDTFRSFDSPFSSSTTGPSGSGTLFTSQRLQQAGPSPPPAQPLPAAPPPLQQQQQQQQQDPSHDWDAIFSGLDQTPNLTGNGRDPFAIEEPGASSSVVTTGYEPPPGPPPSHQQGLAQAANQASRYYAQSPQQQKASHASPPQSNGAGGGARQGQGAGPPGDDDDPILQSLTGMGYRREDALRALEKYDYNLDRAADYLTSRP